MNGAVLSRISWHLRRFLARVGLPGVLAAGLLAFCAAFYFSTLKPLGAELEDLRLSAERLAHRARAGAAPLDREAGPAERLAAFFGTLPEKKDAPETLERLYGAAAESQLTLEQGEYRVAPERAHALLRYEVTLPVKGAYPQVKAFVARALANLPHASLDGISFQRQKVGVPTVEARLKFTLHFREGG